MIKDLPTMEVSMDTTQPGSVPRLNTHNQRGNGQKRKQDRKQSKSSDINDPEPRNR